MSDFYLDLNAEYTDIGDESCVPSSQLDDMTTLMNCDLFPPSLSMLELTRELKGSTTPKTLIVERSPLSCLTQMPKAITSPARTSFTRVGGEENTPTPHLGIGSKAKVTPKAIASRVVSDKMARKKRGRSILEVRSSKLPSSQDEVATLVGNSGELTPQSIEDSLRTVPNLERNLGWMDNETLLLIEGKKRLSDDMQEGTLMKTLRTRPQRWEYISSFLMDMGVVKSGLQCEYKWSRIWKPFKAVFDYEKSIPSGGDSYWQMSTSDRVVLNLPRTFDPKVFASMKSKFGGDRAIDPGDILIDTSAKALLGKESSTVVDPIKDGGSKNASLPTNEDTDSDVVEIPHMRQSDCYTGKKRQRSVRATIVKKEFKESTQDLLHFLTDAENTRKDSDKDLYEITKQQFETNIKQFETNMKLQHERVVAAQQSNSALMEIAGAIKLFSSTRVHHP